MGQNAFKTLESAELLEVKTEESLVAKLRPALTAAIGFLPSVKDSRKGRSHAQQWKILFVVLGVVVALAADPAAIALGVFIATLVFWLPLPALAKRSLLLRVQKMGRREVRTWTSVTLEIRKDVLQAKNGKTQVFRVPLSELVASTDEVRRKAGDLVIRGPGSNADGQTTLRLNEHDFEELRLKVSNP